MTGPAQTPCIFARAGDTGLFFSPDCVKALLEAGYNPEWFGTYQHTQGQISAARARSPQWFAWDDERRRAAADGRPFNTAEPTPRPSAADRYLGQCQSGHMSMDATHREAGTRDNPCGNREFGYDGQRAPCMPQSRGPWAPPGSEHNVVSRHEAACAAAVRADNQRRGVTPVDTYPPALRDQHESQRARLAVDARRGPEHDRQPIDREAYARGQNQAAAAAAGPGGVAAAGGASPAANHATSVPADQQINGNDVYACLDAFRRKGLQAMRQEAVDARVNDRAANRATATTRANQACQPGETPADQNARNAREQSSGAVNDPTLAAQRRAALQQEAQTARRAADDMRAQSATANRSAGTTESWAGRRRVESDAVVEDPFASPQRQTQVRQAAVAQGERAGERERTARNAEGLADSLERRAAQSERRAASVARPDCLATEGDALAAMSPTDRQAAINGPTTRPPAASVARAPDPGYVPPGQQADVRTLAATIPVTTVPVP
jgi:hypothetical protein